MPIALLGLCAMLCGTIATSASAAQSGSACFISRITQSGCTPALVYSSDSEAEEPEEEEIEESEEAATAEAEAEEAENGEAVLPATGVG